MIVLNSAFWVPISHSHETPMISSLPPDNVGDGAVLIDCEDNLNEDVPPPLSRETSSEADASLPLSREPLPLPPPRYPSHVRREPVHFQPFVRY